MNALYDVVCSMVIGGIVLTMILGFNGNIVESAGVQTVRVMAQSNLTAVTSILEYDFRKMGYHVGNNPDSSIIYADSNKIKFIGDFTDKAKIDTIIYSFDPNAPSGKPNRNTHILTRTYIP